MTTSWISSVDIDGWNITDCLNKRRQLGNADPQNPHGIFAFKKSQEKVEKLLNK